MNNEQQLALRYGTTALLLNAADKVLANSFKSTADYLSEGNQESRNLAKALVAGGAGIGAAGAAILGTSATLGVGSVAGGALLTALGGPVVWALIGGGSVLGWITGRIWKNRKKKKQECVEKEQLLKRIITKQQAVIEKLKLQNQLNCQEILNLKELLDMLQNTQTQVQNDFAAV